MTEGGHPSFFSWQFHARFLPGVIWRRITGRLPRGSSHARYEQIIALVAACAAIGFAIAPAMRGSVVAILIAAAGAIGIAVLVIQSVWSARTGPLTYDAFAVAPLIACIVLGADLGLAAGRGVNVETPMRVGYAAVGAIAGYVVGVGAGLMTQRLGWMAAFFSLITGLATIGLILLAFILLV
jgi:hypothetical protein